MQAPSAEPSSQDLEHLGRITVGALIIRIGFWGTLNYNYNKDSGCLILYKRQTTSSIPSCTRVMRKQTPHSLNPLGSNPVAHPCSISYSNLDKKSHLIATPKDLLLWGFHIAGEVDQVLGALWVLVVEALTISYTFP